MRCAAASTSQGADRDEPSLIGAAAVDSGGDLVGKGAICEDRGHENEHDREPTPDETAGMVWWYSLSEADRADWLARAGSAVPADAWAAYKRSGDVDRQPRVVN